jgi:hypothetical protein
MVQGAKIGSSSVLAGNDSSGQKPTGFSDIVNA